MSKLIAVIVLAIAIIGGAYWLSGMTKPWGKTPATTAGPINPGIADGKAPVKGPFLLPLDEKGVYLASKTGMTLYTNLKDENPSGAITATCNAACEKIWPPYLLGNEESAPEKSSDPLLSRLNLYKRADGKYQYALGTTPLYFYTGDKVPTDTLGTLVSGWIVARPPAQ